MKTLLVRPPAKFIDGAIPPAISLPTGLLYLAAVLEQSGHPVAIYDAQLNVDHPVTRDGEGAIHMGDPWEAVHARIASEQPDIVGISCMFSVQMENAIRLAELVKKIDSNIITIIGGSHSTVRPQDFLHENGAIDIACIGEGEATLREIVERRKAGADLSEIPGTAVRDSGAVRINAHRPHNTKLDDTPLPAYHLVDLEGYFRLYAQGYTDRIVPYADGFERSVSVITSRGCPYKCIFCSVHLHMGRAWRPHSVPYVKKHIELLASKYGVRHIHFEDDNISLNAERFRDILNLLINREPKLTWDTPNGLRVDTLTPEIMELCRDSGCMYLIFGVESGNQTVLDTIIDKHLDLQTVSRAAAWAKQIGINAMAFYVIGFPGETPVQINDTVQFALHLQAKYNVNPGLFIATPIPGTRLEQECINRGFIPEPLSSRDLARMTLGSFFIDMGSFTKDDVALAMNTYLKGYRNNVIRQGISLILRWPHRVFRFIAHVSAFSKRLSFNESVARAILLGRWIVRNRVGRP